MSTLRQDLFLDELKAGLRSRAGEIAEHLLGPPNNASRRQITWRWGSKGSVALVVRGANRGAFKCHETGERGGGMLDLVMHARQCGVGEAIRWGAGYLGITPQ